MSCINRQMNCCFDYVSTELKGLIEPATHFSHRFDSLLGTRRFTDAFVAPYVFWDKSIGCIINNDGHAIKDSECIEWKENEVFYDISDCIVDHKKVIYLGFLLNGFGHSYTDDLRKLWYLKSNECQHLIQNGYIYVYTTSWNEPIPEKVLNIFALAGIDISGAYHITHLTRFDEIIIPDNCIKAKEFGRVYCQEYIDLINCIKSSIPDSGLKIPKVYFTRTRFTKCSNKEIGENRIEDVFRKQGYVIVSPEDYTVVEQIQLVRSCDYFAATEGSVSHLTLFCRPQTNVLIINKANYLNFHQVMINEYADLNVTYVEAHHSSKVDKKHPWWGPFYLCVNKFLEHYSKKRIPHLPYWACFSYWEYTRNILFRCYNRAKKVLS